MRASIRSILKLATIAAAASLSLSAQAAPGLTGWTGGFGATSGSDQLYGWLFHVNSAISVSALGVQDTNSDGLSIAHDVGIFRSSDQSLVASTTVGAGLAGTLDAGFRYTALGSSSLLAVGDYVIVMTMPQLNADTQIINATGVTTAAEITWINSAFDGGSVLAYPTTFGAFAIGMFGPNFEFGAAAVPEPETYAMMLAGLGALGFVARRRRSSVPA